MEIWHDWQISPNNGWNGAERLDGAAALIVPARNDVTGRLELFYVGDNGALFHNGQTSPGGPLWTGETEIPTSSDGVRQIGKGPMAVGQNGDGRWELLYIGASSQLYHRSQMSLGGNWTDETPFPGNMADSVAVGQNADSRLELFYTGTDQHLYHRWQMSPGGNWTDQTPFSGDSANVIAVVLNPNRCLELFYIGTDQHLYHRWQTSPNGGPSNNDWTGETPFSDDSANVIAVGQNADGRLELFYIGTDDRFYHRWQLSPGGGPSKNDWSGEFSLPGAIAGVEISIAGSGQNADGRLEFFFTPRLPVVSSIDGRRLRVVGRATTTGLARARFPLSVTKCALHPR